MAFVQDDGRHCVNAVLMIESFALAHFLSIFITGQQRSGTQTIETDGLSGCQQDSVITRVLAVREIGVEQRVLEFALASFAGRPRQQTMGIDLPVKALAWADKAGKVWVSYNDPAWLAARHGTAADVAKVTDALSASLKGAVAKATTP